MLTNFETIQKRIRYLRELEARKERGELERLPKKEAQHLQDEMDRLQRTLGGIKDMRRLPGAVFVIDTKKEHTAVMEARRLEIPVVPRVWVPAPWHSGARPAPFGVIR